MIKKASDTAKAEAIQSQESHAKKQPHIILHYAMANRTKLAHFTWHKTSHMHVAAALHQSSQLRLVLLHETP